MPQRPTISPIDFDPAFEVPEPDEAQTFADMRAAMRHIVEITSRDYGHAVRAVHAKSHGLLTGKVEIAGDLPPALAQGIFARVCQAVVEAELQLKPVNRLAF